MNLEQLLTKAKSGEKLAMLTCYDATFSKLMEMSGVDILLVGDSLGMVLQGFDNTLQVSMAAMIYHTEMVARGCSQTFIMADMPYGSYENNPQLAYRNAEKLIAAGAHMVKLEGGGLMIETVNYLAKRDIPVCAHLGFTPQSVHQLGGYKIQGKTFEAAQKILNDAKLMSEAGAGFVLLEMVPAMLAKQITESIQTPTIGIGAGVDCSGQVLVLQDLLGIYTGVADKNPNEHKSPRFVKNFLTNTSSIQQSIVAYVQAVKSKNFPAAEHSY